MYNKINNNKYIFIWEEGAFSEVNHIQFTAVYNIMILKWAIQRMDFLMKRR